MASWRGIADCTHRSMETFGRPHASNYSLGFFFKAFSASRLALRLAGALGSSSAASPPSLAAPSSAIIRVQSCECLRAAVRRAIEWVSSGCAKLEAYVQFRKRKLGNAYPRRHCSREVGSCLPVQGGCSTTRNHGNPVSGTSQAPDGGLKPSDFRGRKCTDDKAYCGKERPANMSDVTMFACMYARCSICLSGQGMAFESNITQTPKIQVTCKIRMPMGHILWSSQTWGISSKAVAARAKPRTVFFVKSIVAWSVLYPRTGSRTQI